LARWPIIQARHDRDQADARELLGEEAFVAALTEGRSMSLIEVLSFALAVPTPI
jgi:hypothetical protein